MKLSGLDNSVTRDSAPLEDTPANFAESMRMTIRIGEVAAMMGKSVKTIRRWIDCGALLKPLDLPGPLLWRRRDVLDWLDQQQSRK